MSSFWLVLLLTLSRSQFLVGVTADIIKEFTYILTTILKIVSINFLNLCIEQVICY